MFNSCPSYPGRAENAGALKLSNGESELLELLEVASQHLQRKIFPAKGGVTLKALKSWDPWLLKKCLYSNNPLQGLLLILTRLQHRVLTRTNNM